MEVLSSFISSLLSFILAIVFMVAWVVVFIGGFIRVYRQAQEKRWDWRSWGRALESQTDMVQVAGSQDDQKQEIGRAFAEAHGLMITLSSALTRMSGEYRGHHLVLEIRASRNTGTICAVLDAAVSEERTVALQRRLGELSPGSVIGVLLPSGFVFQPGRLTAGGSGRRLSYEEGEFPWELDKLGRVCNLLGDLADGYPAVVAVGGAAAPALQTIVKRDNLLRDVAVEMLKDIAQATQSLGGRAEQLLCPRCLACCSAHRADLPGQPDVTYYGCRACHQSREFIDCPKGVVAVLNDAWRSAQTLHNGLLGVNWLARRALFDFDRVEIVRATDKDVEQFAMQVGNDTDPYRKSRYGRTRCTIAPICHPCENTLRILENTFGRVDA
jgi:hypothetical protein